MKIAGVWGEFNAPYISAIVKCEKPRLETPIQFLIDSGATRTTILDNDVARLGIEIKELEKSKSGSVGIGGMVDSFIIRDVRLVFRSDEGPYEVVFERISVIKHDIQNTDEQEMIRKIPSLLGRDVINQFQLVLDKERNLVTLSKE